MVEGLARGIGWSLVHPGMRRPLSTTVYRMYLQLRSARLLRLENIESRLPPVRDDLLRRHGSMGAAPVAEGARS
jgi:hypothetical protein